MRIRLTITAAGGGWVVTATSPDDAGWTPAARQLPAPEGVAGFPRPDASEGTRSTGRPWATIVAGSDADLRVLQQNVLFGDVAAGDTAKLGGYLFETLLGPVWDDAVARFANQDIDIEIALPVAAVPLQMLPWELMFAGNEPLVARTPNRVSITRVVDGAAAGSPQLEIPIRLLFIVGKLDAKLRPGAEYLGLLRQIGSRVTAGGKTAEGPALRARILLDATSGDVAEAVDAFSPNAIHVVAHGRRDAGRSVIVLAKQSGTALVDDPHDATEFAKLLQGNSGKAPLPHLVVVNACETANPGDHLPFAAGLVSNGIAAAVGMSGEVQDAACRVFTAFFYRALGAQQSVAQATASGQRATLLHYAHYHQSAEWARPALFLASDAITAPKSAASAEEMAIITAAGAIRGAKRAPMCGRYRQFRRYEEFAAAATTPGRPRLLAFEQAADDKPYVFPGGAKLDYKIGKTRLLSELEWISVLDRLVPCHLRANEGNTIAASFLHFAVLLAEAMDAARESAGLKKEVITESQELAFDVVLGKPHFVYDRNSPGDFEKDLGEIQLKLAKLALAETTPPKTIIPRIRRDLERLVNDVRQIRPSTRGVLVLIDDLHRYEGVFSDILKMINQHGMGTESAPAPVIVSYSPKRDRGLDVQALLNNEADVVKPWTIIEKLYPFSPDPEGHIAYAQFLQSKCWTPKRGAQGQAVFEQFVEKAHSEISGVPGWLPIAEYYVKALKERLAPVDDEAILSLMNAND